MQPVIHKNQYPCPHPHYVLILIAKWLTQKEFSSLKIVSCTFGIVISASSILSPPPRFISLQVLIYNYTTLAINYW